MAAKIKIKSLLFASIIFMSACKNNSPKTTSAFVVPTPVKPVLADNSNKIPPPPEPERAFYFGFNFIVDSSGQIFYYQQKTFNNPLNDEITDWNAPPKFIGIEPKDIVQLPVRSIEEFINLNILPAKALNRRVALASLKDTIVSAGIEKILNVLNDSTKHISLLFRKATIEETTVLSYKKKGTYYDAEEINWDTAQIRYFPKYPKPIKFTNPNLKRNSP